MLNYFLHYFYFILKKSFEKKNLRTPRNQYRGDLIILIFLKKRIQRQFIELNLYGLAFQWFWLIARDSHDNPPPPCLPVTIPNGQRAKGGPLLRTCKRVPRNSIKGLPVGLNLKDFFICILLSKYITKPVQPLFPGTEQGSQDHRRHVRCLGGQKLGVYFSFSMYPRVIMLLDRWRGWRNLLDAFHAL